MTESTHPAPGDTYRLFYNDNNPNNKLVHVRAIVDGNQVVCRTWWYSKRRWHYWVEDILWFDVAKEHLTRS